MHTNACVGVEDEGLGEAEEACKKSSGARIDSFKHG